MFKFGENVKRQVILYTLIEEKLYNLLKIIWWYLLHTPFNSAVLLRIFVLQKYVFRYTITVYKNAHYRLVHINK